MGLTSLILYCLAGEERRDGGNPLSQKVVGVKNSPLLTLISKIPLFGVQLRGSLGRRGKTERATYHRVPIWSITALVCFDCAG